MKQFGQCSVLALLSACSQPTESGWIYSKSHDPVLGIDTSSSQVQVKDQTSPSSIIDVKISCEGPVMWINIGSYYSSNERDSQLDGDEYVSELIYNLDDAGQFLRLKDLTSRNSTMNIDTGLIIWSGTI
jgi:hypothetical protein